MTMNFLTYYDRGVLAAALPHIKTDHYIARYGILSSVQGGSLVSIFMAGYMAMCPIFAMGERWMRPTRIVSLGLLIWTMAAMSCAMVTTFSGLAVARGLVGIGEAAYAGFACTIIDDMAPKSSRTLWIGLYFSMLAVGQAAGMAMGGIISQVTAGSFTGWRLAFLTEGIAMLPILVLVFLLPLSYNPARHHVTSHVVAEPDFVHHLVGEPMDYIAVQKEQEAEEEFEVLRTARRERRRERVRSTPRPETENTPLRSPQVPQRKAFSVERPPVTGDHETWRYSFEESPEPSCEEVPQLELPELPTKGQHTPSTRTISPRGAVSSHKEVTLTPYATPRRHDPPQPTPAWGTRPRPHPVARDPLLESQSSRTSLDISPQTPRGEAEFTDHEDGGMGSSSSSASSSLDSVTAVSLVAPPLHPWEAITALVTNSVWNFTVLGYALFTFVIGGIAVWTITYLEEGPLQLDEWSASVFFGICTAVTGLVGTAMGGKLVDWLGGSNGLYGLRNCHRIDVVLIVLAFPLGLGALMCTNPYAFFVLMFLGELLIFGTSAPVNAATLSAVSPALRTYAMSFSVFLIHLLGDFPSPVIAGALADRFNRQCRALGQNESECVANGCHWIRASHASEESVCMNRLQTRNALIIIMCFLLLCAAAWGVAWRLTVLKIRQAKAREAQPLKEEMTLVVKT